MRVSRVVVDTNVLISAALRSQGLPRTVVNALRSAEIAVLFSSETFKELGTRIHRRKFDRYLVERQREAYLGQIESVAECVAISGARMGCRDPDDDKFLETALEGGADCLITGDRELLEMSPFRDIPILSPADFLAMRGESAPLD